MQPIPPVTVIRQPIRTEPYYNSQIGQCYITKWNEIFAYWDAGKEYTREEIIANVIELRFWVNMLLHERTMVNSYYNNDDTQI